MKTVKLFSLTAMILVPLTLFTACSGASHDPGIAAGMIEVNISAVSRTGEDSPR